MLIRPLDWQALGAQYVAAKPYPFVKIENFLDPTLAAEIAAAYPSLEQAGGQGTSFNAVNERKKTQITNSKLFPGAVARLNEALASPEFLSDLSYISGIPELMADEQLVGGGMHMTGPGGRLDVHVDFNYMEDRKIHRRLNLLLYLNPKWDPAWGGHIQLWDRDVSRCHESFSPAFNRCVIFETSEISFHGVTPITTDAQFPRISFAAYYYTREAPPNWDGKVHSTVFKARPEERMRRYVLMPAEKLQRQLASGVQTMKRGVKRLVKAGN